jgi:formylmethanofuran--tetrahydromethanopterin N-formyltransferase
MKIKNVTIFDTFAEAWTLEVVRVVLTATSTEVAMGGAHQFAGAAGSSMIGSRINAGIERVAWPQETPDGRPGVFVSMAMPPDQREAMLKEVELRIALASLIPTAAVFNAPAEGVPGEMVNIHDKFNVSAERWAGYDTERELAGRHLCVLPTTTGEFVYEKSYKICTNGTDGHFVCFAESETAAVAAVAAAKDALVAVDGAAPMGYGLEQVFREYDYIPSLRDKIEDSKVPDGVSSILNLLMFGASPALMKQAMAASLRAAAQVPGVMYLGAMNFGGEFGKHQYHLHELLK